MRKLPNPAKMFDEQHGHLFPWSAVLMGVGVGVYFSLRFEPDVTIYAGLAVALAIFLGLIWLTASQYAPYFVACAMICVGFLAAGGHANLSAAPVLGFRYYGPVEGRVVKIDRSQSDRTRLTLDQVVLHEVPPHRTPAHVRVAMHGWQDAISPKPGMTVILTAHLSPPQGPVEPNGFDFRRNAWFQQLGAVGYTRTPVLTLHPAPPDAVWLAQQRFLISKAVRQHMEGDAGAFGAAIMTGDRSEISPEVLAALRHSNLAHLLAISGLHMGLLTGFVFAMFRFGLALLPGVALRYPVKKIAAVGALIVAAVYLALSGGNVATVRAFVMVSVMLTAVMLDRRAISLHAVAVAALIVLALQPESLIGPGFQMSFSATVALVAVFAFWRDHNVTLGPKWVRPVITVLVSSAVAGAATAPFSAAHFNQFSQFGLLANLLSVPLMGAVVVPAAVGVVLLAPFGLAALPFAIMELGINWILMVARWVSGLDGATIAITAPQPIVVPLIAVGGLIAILWQGRLRLLGAVVLAVAGIIWHGTERPHLLISERGGLVGVLTPAGRVLNRQKGEGFVAGIWLENDGDTAAQVDAAQRIGFSGNSGRRQTSVGSQQIAVLSGRGVAEIWRDYCAGGALVVMTKSVPDQPNHCQVFSPEQLSGYGSIAGYLTPDGLKLETASERIGNRLWVQ